jgi:hypothetical protein
MVMRVALVAVGVATAAIAALAACNSVLGIDEASPESHDGGAVVVEGGSEVDGASTVNDDPLTCANYCQVVAQNCTGEFLEYLPSTNPEGGASTDPCLDLCSQYLSRNLGTYAPPSGPEPAVETGSGTLACRLWHAHAAASMKHPEIHCRHAGPLGSELCGDPCTAFCNLDFSYCVDDNNVQAYSSQSQCESACIDSMGAAVASDAGFSYSQDIGDLVDDSGTQISSGNTLNCRLWHLETSVQEGMPAEHCWHTAYPSMNPPAAPGDPATTGGPCGP